MNLTAFRMQEFKRSLRSTTAFVKNTFRVPQNDKNSSNSSSETDTFADAPYNSTVPSSIWNERAESEQAAQYISQTAAGTRAFHAGADGRFLLRDARRGTSAWQLASVLLASRCRRRR